MARIRVADAMTDIRKRVEEDQGILKTIQKFVPGFRGYRLKEDLRDSDRMLRSQLTKLLGRQRRGLEDCRAKVAQNYNSSELEVIGGLINRFKRVEGLVLHAETGYSGIAADLQVKETQLNRLYEYDTSLIDNIGIISKSVDSLKISLKANDSVQSGEDIAEIRDAIIEFEDKFDRRMRVITNSEV
jgi:hypothetical protein